MILGIRLKPGKPGAKPQPSVFYCGLDGVAFRKLHADLVTANTDGSTFHSIVNPLLTPLANVKHNTEDHPDHVAAMKKREELAAKKAPKQAELTGTNPDAVAAEKSAKRQAELLGQTRGELLNLAGELNKDEKVTAKIDLAAPLKKSELVAAILTAEGLTPNLTGTVSEE